MGRRIRMKKTAIIAATLFSILVLSPYAWFNHLSPEAKQMNRLGHSSYDVNSVFDLKTKKKRKGKGSYTRSELAPTNILKIDGITAGQNCQFDLVFGKDSLGSKSCVTLIYTRDTYFWINSRFDDLIQSTGWSNYPTEPDVKSIEFEGQTYQLPRQLYMYSAEHNGLNSNPFLPSKCLPRLEVVQIPSRLYPGVVITEHIKERLESSSSYDYLFNFFPHPECFKVEPND